MNRISTAKRIFLMVSLMAAFLGAARAQGGIDELFNSATQAMRGEKWAAGLKALTQIVDRFGKDAKTDFGPRFGAIYYNKGICHFRLGQYGEAVDAFKICHNDFKNDGTNTKAAEAGRNPFYTISVFHWAASEQYAENYPEAIELYQKFSALKPEAGTYNLGAWMVNMSICYGKTGEIGKSALYLQKAIDGRIKMKSNGKALFQGFVVLAEAWAAKGKEAAADAHKFLNKYDGQLRLSPYQMESSLLNKKIFNAGLKLNKAELEDVAIRVISFVANTQDVVEELKTGTPSKRRSAAIQKFQAIIDSGNPIDVDALMATAQAYEKRGAFRAGYGIYGYLANQFKKSTRRPQILYQATRMSALSNDMNSAQHYGLTFLQEFPKHELKDAVSSLLLEQLFYAGKYEKCLEIGRKIRGSMEVGSKMRDLPDFVVGGSLYFLGKFDEAQPEIDEHVKHYPESPFREQAHFYQAANMVKLFRWAAAARKLDDFVKTYPKSKLMDLVYLDRANCHFASDEFDKTMALATKVTSEFPGSSVVDRANLLKGDVEFGRSNLEKSVNYYNTAKTQAEGLGHDETAGNAISQLVNTQANLKQWKPAVALYDEFMGKYPESYWKPFVLVNAVPALNEVGRTDEALKALEDLIIEVGQDPESPNLERAIGSYSNFYGELKGPVALVERLKDFPNVPPGNKTLKAWLIAARLDVLEDPANGEKFDRLAARQTVAYADLEKIDIKNLPNYICYKIGKNFQDKKKRAPALKFYDEIIGRSSIEFKDYAMLGSAQLRVDSAQRKERTLAEEHFKKVVAENNPELSAEATLGLGRLYFNGKQYSQAVAESVLPEYMRQKTWGSNRPEVTWMAGRAYEETNKKDKALKCYAIVIGTYSGHLEYSADSWIRAAKIQWNKGKRDNAYAMLRDMVHRMSHLAGDKRDKKDRIKEAILLRQNWAGAVGANWEEEDAKDEELREKRRR